MAGTTHRDLSRARQPGGWISSILASVVQLCQRSDEIWQIDIVQSVPMSFPIHYGFHNFISRALSSHLYTGPVPTL